MARTRKGSQPSKSPIKGKNITGGPSFLSGGTLMRGSKAGGKKTVGKRGGGKAPGTKR